MASDVSERAVRGSASAGRRELVVQAAIEVLAQHGGRGLSHRRVDSHLGWPLGSTANFFSRRDDILVAIAEHIVQLDAADLAFERNFEVADGISQELFISRIERLLKKWLRPAFGHRLAAGAEVLLESRRNPHVAKAVTAQLSVNEAWYRRIFAQLGSADPAASAKLFSFLMSSFYMGTCVARHLPNKVQVHELVTNWVVAGRRVGAPANHVSALTDEHE